MISKYFSAGAPPQPATPKEGDLFKVLKLHGQTFRITYGYYEACDRENPAVDPMPIYPDFAGNPTYSLDGFPFVTKMQDACKEYQGKQSQSAECAECAYYLHGEELLGLCTCPRNQKNNSSQKEETL